MTIQLTNCGITNYLNSFIFIRGNLYYTFLTFTTQRAKGVRKSDPETMRGFTGVEFSPGKMHTQSVTNRGTKKQPFPNTLPTVGGSEKVTLGQLNPQRPAHTDIVI